MIRAHWSFWLIGALALIWNGLGTGNFFVQMNPDALAMYRESERLMIESRPAWATAGFALSVFAGTLGSILLLFRKSVAVYLFSASLIGTVVTMMHSIGIGISFGIGEFLGIVLMPVAVPVLLIAYTKAVKRKRWIS